MCTACWEDPHAQSMLVHAVLQGSPATSHALRVTLFDCSPAWVTQPPTTCPIEPGSIPLRASSPLCAAPRIRVGCRPESHPLRRPTGVRTASTITASGLVPPVVQRCRSQYLVYGVAALRSPPQWPRQWVLHRAARSARRHTA